MSSELTNILTCDPNNSPSSNIQFETRIVRNINSITSLSLLKKKLSYPCNRPWRPIGLWDVEAPTFSRQSAHRWRWGCETYAPTALYSPGRFPVLISVGGWVDTRTIMHLEVLCKFKDKSNYLIGNRTRGLPACSIVPQPTTLPHAPISLQYFKYLILCYLMKIYLLGYNAVSAVDESQKTSRKIVSPPSSGSKHKRSKKSTWSA
jgi:hypothetical protein